MQVMAEKRLARLKAMIELIYSDVFFAIEVEAALETANNIVMGELRGVHFYGAECYNAAKQSMVVCLALTLAKLFDIPHEKNKDVVSIPVMIDLLKQEDCRADWRAA